jgi:F0F1-type ATP synthase delta subunit
MARLSRRKIATHAVNKLLAGSSKQSVIRELAAFLVDSGRTREMELLVRDIEDLLAERGTVVAEVTSAHPLATTLKADIKKLIGARDLQLREVTDKDVLGGVRIDLPGKRFDGTLRHKLTLLKAKQV